MGLTGPHVVCVTLRLHHEVSSDTSGYTAGLHDFYLVF